MKVVILAGGMGTRLHEKTRLLPKPMVEIGGMPILWHIMKEYSHYGFNDFVICAGYMQHLIKDWFFNYFIRKSDITLDFSNGRNDITIHRNTCERWRVTVVDTGLNTMTGGRIARIRDHIGNAPFFMTYGDGVCDVNIGDLLLFHKKHGKIATLTAVIPEQQKGCLCIGENNSVRSFREKSAKDASPINAGYMVLNPEIFEYLSDDNCVFEGEPLNRLVAQGQLMSYIHHGFWQCMDNIRELEILEKLYNENKAPWKSW